MLVVTLVVMLVKDTAESSQVFVEEKLVRFFVVVKTSVIGIAAPVLVCESVPEKLVYPRVRMLEPQCKIRQLENVTVELNTVKVLSFAHESAYLLS